MANFPSQARTVTAQELYGPAYKALTPARVFGPETARVIQTAGDENAQRAAVGDVAGALGGTVRGALAALPALAIDTGRTVMGASDTVFGPYMRAGERFGRGLLGVGPETPPVAALSSVPAARKVQPPIARQAPAQALAQPSRMAAQLPKFAFDAQSGTTAYQIDPSARGWRPAHEGGAPSGYAGPLDYIRVSRDPRSGVLSFSGTGQKITPQGEAYQPPPQAPLSQSQRDVMEVQSHFKGGVPQTREDWALFEGLLDNIVKQRESGAERQQSWDDRLAQIMGQTANRKQPGFQDQLGQDLYNAGIQRYQSDPESLLAFMLELYTKQQRLQSPAKKEE